jgi:hypothetical protein
VVAFVLVLAACGGQPPRPTGPAPEYEVPAVVLWDSGSAVDPLDEIDEAILDRVPEPRDAGGADAEVDAGGPDG